MNEHKNDLPAGNGEVADTDLSRVTNSPEERARAEARFLAEQREHEANEDIALEDWSLEVRGKRIESAADTAKRLGYDKWVRRG
jgi:hypothetical protein